MDCHFAVFVDSPDGPRPVALFRTAEEARDWGFERYAWEGFRVGYLSVVGAELEPAQSDARSAA